MSSATRPEHIAPPDIFYNEEEAKKYGTGRMLEIQTAMSERAIELLQLPTNRSCYLLDLGCGSGLSGAVLSDQNHVWVGLDISQAMLGVALERGAEGDLVYSDMGDGLPFRPGSFDAAVSISALQWLCNADKKHHEPKKRALRFFKSLYAVLTRGGKAVFQFYPESADSVSLLTKAAMQAGFSGGLVIDYPHSTKAKKYFLVLFAGEPDGPRGSRTPYQLPTALDGMPPPERGSKSAAAGSGGSGSGGGGGDDSGMSDEGESKSKFGLKSAAAGASTASAGSAGSLVSGGADTWAFNTSGDSAAAAAPKDQKTQQTVVFEAAAYVVMCDETVV